MGEVCRMVRGLHTKHIFYKLNNTCEKIATLFIFTRKRSCLSGCLIVPVVVKVKRIHSYKPDTKKDRISGELTFRYIPSFVLFSFRSHLF